MIKWVNDIGELVKGFETFAIDKYNNSKILLRVFITTIILPIIIPYYLATRTIKIVSKFCSFAFRPLIIIKRHSLAFLVWLAFTLFGGLTGVIVNIFRKIWFVYPSISVQQAITSEFENGSFYTYSIATIAAGLGSVFIQLAEAKKEELNFRRYQVIMVSVSIFIILFGGVFYALLMGKSEASSVAQTSELVIDWQQLIVFVLSVTFSVFSFCVVRLDKHKDEFSDLQDPLPKNEEAFTNPAPEMNTVQSNKPKEEVNDG